jgi:hypothetical protein
MLDDTRAPWSRYQLPNATLTVVVAFAAPATGLFTVDVDQSEYSF